MKKLNLVLLSIAMISVLFSCSKDELENAEAVKSKSLKSTKFTESAVVPADVCNDQPVILDLIAGQYMDAGSVSVVNDDEYIYVTFETTDVCLQEVHVYIGDAADVPLKNKTPIPGQFPYAAKYINEFSFTLAIPIDPDWECPIILAHAQLCNGETAWGRGDDKYFTLKLWYFNEVNYRDWAVVEAIDQYYFTGYYCDLMGVPKLTDDVTLNLMREGIEQIGTVNIDIEGDKIFVNIIFNSAEFEIDETHAFYGTLAELDAYSYGVGCPNYPAFPYPAPGDDQASFEIPYVASSFTFKNYFNSPRWGFLGEYCVVACE